MPDNPLQKPEQDVALPAGERGIGGYGIFLVNKLTHGIRYAYKDNMNILTIRKNFDRKNTETVCKGMTVSVFFAAA